MLYYYREREGRSKPTQTEEGIMQCRIAEANEIKSLSIIADNGVDWALDFIGNAGALADGQFCHDEDSDTYECSQETYDWWARHIERYQEMETRIEQAREAGLSDEQIEAARAHYGDGDEEDGPQNVMDALDEIASADLGLDPKRMYMNPATGTVQSGEDWQADRDSMDAEQWGGSDLMLCATLREYIAEHGLSPEDGGRGIEFFRPDEVALTKTMADGDAELHIFEAEGVRCGLLDTDTHSVLMDEDELADYLAEGYSYPPEWGDMGEHLTRADYASMADWPAMPDWYAEAQEQGYNGSYEQYIAEQQARCKRIG
jgi:hypothetical protein